MSNVKTHISSLAVSHVNSKPSGKTQIIWFGACYV